MKPIDKFGNRIYSSIFDHIKQTALALDRLGYSETKKTQNLFLKPKGNVTFFADFRGTEIVKIWEDTRPLIFWQPNTFDSEEENRVLIDKVLEEFESFGMNGISVRISFREEAEPGSLSLEFTDYIGKYLSNRFNIPEFLFYEGFLHYYDLNGICITCLRDLHNKGFFCSDICRDKYVRRTLAIALNDKLRCEVCGLLLVGETDRIGDLAKEYLGIHYKTKLERHHISYFPEKTISVCADCHSEINNKDSYPHLKPPKGDSSRFYKRSE